jgi:hypothetical protein
MCGLDPCEEESYCRRRAEQEDYDPHYQEGDYEPGDADTWGED